MVRAFLCDLFRAQLKARALIGVRLKLLLESWMSSDDAHFFVVQMHSSVSVAIDLLGHELKEEV